VGIVVAACGGPVHPAKVAPPNPNQILPAPAGLIAGGAPQANGTMWLLAGAASARTLQEINLLTAKIVKIVPINADADSVVESSGGLLAVGYASPGGAVEFRNGSSGALVHAVTIGAPVKAIADGGDSTTFYVLSGNGTEDSVSAVSSVGSPEPPGVSVPLATIALAVGNAGGQLYLLQNSGTVVDTPLGPAIGQPLASASFFVGDGAVQLALSADGSLLFVLKGSGNAMNIGVFNVDTEQQRKVLPAPSNSIDVLASIDGTHIYVLVGTPTVGNIQVYPVGR